VKILKGRVGGKEFDIDQIIVTLERGLHKQKDAEKYKENFLKSFIPSCHAIRK
jgi:hypothetical protein